MRSRYGEHSLRKIIRETGAPFVAKDTHEESLPEVADWLDAHGFSKQADYCRNWLERISFRQIRRRIPCWTGKISDEHIPTMLGEWENSDGTVLCLVIEIRGIDTSLLDSQGSRSLMAKCRAALEHCVPFDSQSWISDYPILRLEVRLDSSYDSDRIRSTIEWLKLATEEVSRFVASNLDRNDEGDD